MAMRTPLWLAVILFTACAAQNKVIFIPDPAQENLREEAGLQESWQIIESQNGPADAEIPVWVRGYLDGGIRKIESLDTYNGKYVFVGKNRGGNFNALQQWANGFTVAQDLPALIVKRVERRLIASATLYPDDEYGEYFASMIKKVSDGEFTEAHKEQIFWIKQKKIPASGGDTAYSEIPPENDVSERYEFLILISTDKEVLQTKLQEIMADIKTDTAPTKGQAAAINKIHQTFFEGF